MNAQEVLAQHQSESLRCFLPCGHQSMNRADLAAHQLDALKAAGYVVVQKPWADSDSPSSWLGETVSAIPGSGRIYLYVERHRLTKLEAREIAGALLAAADAAEVTQ